MAFMRVGHNSKCSFMNVIHCHTTHILTPETKTYI